MITPPIALTSEPVACTGLWPLFFAPAVESFAERAVREQQAKALCHACPVLGPCGEYALATGQHEGIWAGLNEEELAAERVRRSRKQVAA
jgi:WhiB family redox-sensing transcriptional regulator